MGKRLLAPIAVLFIVLFSAGLTGGLSATVPIGVKAGDWIEYRAVTSGAPPEGHDATWGRMEVKNIVGNDINFNVTTLMADGSYLYENVTLNLEKGQLGDDFLVPPRLSVGDKIFDARSGNITIADLIQRTYAGATRQVILGNTQNTAFVWDRESGILVEAHSSFSALNFTMDTVVEKTNIWQSQIANQDLRPYYLLIAVALAAVFTLGIRRTIRKKKELQKVSV